MGLIYSITNFINDDCILTANSEDDLYVLENLYNQRPSKPYRTTGIGAPPGSPEFICVNLGTYSGVEYEVTLAAIFNHNLTQLEVANDELRLKGCVDFCSAASGSCDWDNPDCERDLTTMRCAGTQPIPNFLNTYHKIDCPAGYQYWRLDMIDQGNAAGYLEIGEFWLGQWQEFHKGDPDDNWVHLQPGRADGPMFWMGNQRTHYGQDWTNYRSDAEHFSLRFKNVNDPCIVDEIHAFLRAVQQTGGRFVLIPDDRKPFCYYVLIENLKNYADRLVYGDEGELREWKLELKTLTQGVALLP